MISIFLTGCLFFFISSTLGYIVVQRWFSLSKASLFDHFLIGIAAQLVYFNVWSFFLPTNYFALTVPLIIAAAVAFRTNYYKSAKDEISKLLSIIFSKQYAVITLSVLAVFAAFSCVVPYNEDSAGYHYLSILWTEKFRIIPGLANLSAKYGTHSSFFVLSAAYSFTDITEQAIYPANFVILPIFCFWLLYKSFVLTDARRYFLWLMLLVLFRFLLINVASPSPDTLSTVLLFYTLYTFASGNWKDRSEIMIILAFTAVTLKLNTIPILLLIFYILFQTPKRNIGVAFIAGILVFIPWLARGVFISGYPLFPSAFFDFFNVDWKVPAAVAEAEKTHIVMSPRLLEGDFLQLKKLPLTEWLPTWYMKLWKLNFVNAVVVSAALISPMVWLCIFKKSNRIQLIVYIISYIGVWFWILTSPDIRFGIVFKLFCIFIPISLILLKVRLSLFYQLAGTGVMVIACVYYFMIGYNKIPVNFFSDNLFLPPRDAWYYKNNDLETYRYIILNNKVKLYVWDSAHHSVNAPLPVFSAPERPGIDTGVNVELRGVDVQQGFRYKKR
jgi:hypothetical protein